MWLVNLLKKKGLWAVQVTHHIFVRKSLCNNHRPRHHPQEALWNDCCFPIHLLRHLLLGISGYTDLLLHAVHPAFIFLTPGWKWKSKAHNHNRKNWKMWGNGVMYMCIDVCQNPLSCWFSAVSKEILTRQQLELPSMCLCFFQIIGDKVSAKRNDSVNHLGTL